LLIHKSQGIFNMNITTTRRLRGLLVTTLFAAVASGLASLPAAAAAGFDPPAVTVNFADLDISQSAGATTLYHRIRAAAQNVCSPFDRPGLRSKMQLDACVDKAVADTVLKVDRPALTAVYDAKTGKIPLARVASAQSR
jgi:UrcA family protein